MYCKINRPSLYTKPSLKRALVLRQDLLIPPRELILKQNHDWYPVDGFPGLSGGDCMEYIAQVPVPCQAAAPVKVEQDF